MDNITKNDPRDALLLLSASDAGKKEIDEFLRGDAVGVSKRCFEKIMKRIRHPQNYIGGRLTPCAKAVGVLLIAVLALLFASLGFFTAKLTYELSYAGDKTSAIQSSEVSVKTAVIPEITVFSSPVLDGTTQEVLVKSSVLYNIKYITNSGVFYYSQKPIYNSQSTKKDGSDARTIKTIKEEKAEKADICVLIGEYEGYVTVRDNGEKAATGEKVVELYFEDNDYSYTIYGVKTIEEAVKIARCIKSE